MRGRTRRRCSPGCAADARRVEADAAALLAEYKHAAYSEARQRQRDAHNAVTFAHWGRVALAVARLTGKRVGLDTATRMAMDADFRGKRERLSSLVREPLPDIDPIEELRRTLEEDE
jgi:hypothetical protein